MSTPKYPIPGMQNVQAPDNKPMALLALRRAAQRAREEARRAGTAVVIFENGQVREENHSETGPTG